MSTPFYSPGRYRCEMLKQGIGEASTGNAQIIWRFRVLETENGEQVPGQYERTAYCTITEKTMPYIVEDLKTLGFEHDSFKFLDPSQPGYQDFTGAIFVAFCTHENAQSGGQREKWGIATQREFEIKPIDNSKLRQLDTLFGKSLKEFKKGGPKPIAQKAATAAGVTDDDVPF